MANGADPEHAKELEMELLAKDFALAKVWQPGRGNISANQVWVWESGGWGRLLRERRTDWFHRYQVYIFRRRYFQETWGTGWTSAS